ncbi:MAG TPA: UDP-glucose 4-epimerase, partial [Lachnospiraceae bacterium]|nr:UDP-glucose 4-epimerase [Lachnospiraceae bacterium]
MAILLTGGAGYIGTHTLVELLNGGYEAVVMDNYTNSSPKALERVKEITGKDFKSYDADIRNREDLEKIFSENDITEVIN